MNEKIQPDETAPIQIEAEIPAHAGAMIEKGFGDAFDAFHVAARTDDRIGPAARIGKPERTRG